MKAHEIMTRDVVKVGPEAGVREVAALMIDKRVSGVPVVADDGRIVGMLTEGDLLHRMETQTEKRRSRLAAFFADPDKVAQQFSKSHGLKAHEVMTRHVVAVREDADLNEVADVLDRNRIRRVPVVRDGKLVGIISRRDLVRIFSQTAEPAAGTARDDASIQLDILSRMRSQSWLDAGYVSVTVRGGAVEVWGIVRSPQQRDALRVLIEEVEGVKRVDDNLRIGLPSVSGGWV